MQRAMCTRDDCCFGLAIEAQRDETSGKGPAQGSAGAVAARGLPFVVYTGYSDIPPECKPHAALRKTVDRETILRTVAASASHFWNNSSIGLLSEPSAGP